MWLWLSVLERSLYDLNGGHGIDPPTYDFVHWPRVLLETFDPGSE